MVITDNGAPWSVVAATSAAALPVDVQDPECSRARGAVRAVRSCAAEAGADATLDAPHAGSTPQEGSAESSPQWIPRARAGSTAGWNRTAVSSPEGPVRPAAVDRRRPAACARGEERRENTGQGWPPALPSCCSARRGSRSRRGPGASRWGDIRFICDLTGPEDLAVVPGAEWVIASGEPGGGADSPRRRGREDDLRPLPDPGPDRAARPGGLADLPRPPSIPRSWTGTSSGPTASISIPVRDGVHTLYVVHHGRRESIEVFEVDAAAGPVTLAWVGVRGGPGAAAPQLGGGAAGGRFRGDEHLHRGRLGVARRGRLVVDRGHRGHDAERSRDFPRRDGGSTSRGGAARS